MSSIVTKIEDIDFKSSAVTIFCPDGDVISMNKLSNMSLHVEYLYAMSQLNEKTKGILNGIDFKYYLKEPVKLDSFPNIITNNIPIKLDQGSGEAVFQIT